MSQMPSADTIRRYRKLARSFPELSPVTEQVADVSDAEQFPNIAEAIDHARKLRLDTFLEGSS